MDFAKLYGMDGNAEQNGKNFRLGVGSNGKPSFLKIARARNKFHLRFLEDSISEEESSLAIGGDNNEPGTLEIYAKIFANCLLLGWENMEDEGKIIPYSTQNAYSLLVKYKELRTFVITKAALMENFKKQQEEKQVKK